MKDRLLTGWTAQRWLRLVFAFVFLVAGVTRHEPVAFVAAAFFGVQALFNVGCCGAASCAPRPTSEAAAKGVTSDVVHEEIT